MVAACTPARSKREGQDERRRTAENQGVLQSQSLRAAQVEKPYASDMLSQAIEEAEIGAMTIPCR